MRVRSTARRGRTGASTCPPRHGCPVPPPSSPPTPPDEPDRAAAAAAAFPPLFVWLFLQAHLPPSLPRSRERERSMSWRWALARRVAALAAGSGAGGAAQAQRLLTTSSGAGAALLGRQHLPLASQIRSKVHSPSQSPSVRLRRRWCPVAAALTLPAMCLRLCRHVLVIAFELACTNWFVPSTPILL